MIYQVLVNSMKSFLYYFQTLLGHLTASSQRMYAETLSFVTCLNFTEDVCHIMMICFPSLYLFEVCNNWYPEEFQLLQDCTMFRISQTTYNKRYSADFGIIFLQACWHL